MSGLCFLSHPLDLSPTVSRSPVLSHLNVTLLLTEGTENRQEIRLAYSNVDPEFSGNYSGYAIMCVHKE